MGALCRQCSHMHEGSCAREDSFTVVFYGSKTFYCKTAQFGETSRESVCSGVGLKNRLRNVAKTRAKTLS
jgi:hypothetical protein